MQEITQTVADYYGIDIQKILEKGRQKETVKARRMAILLIVEEKPSSLHKIGEFFGMGHDNIIHHRDVLRHELKLGIYEDIIEDYRALKKLIRDGKEVSLIESIQYSLEDLRVKLRSFSNLSLDASFNLFAAEIEKLK